MNKSARGDSEAHPLALSEEDRIIKNGDLLGLWDDSLDIALEGAHFHGIFWKGMRYISRWLLQIGDARPLPFSTSGESINSRKPSPFFGQVRLLGPSLSRFLPFEPEDPFRVEGEVLTERSRFCGPTWILEEVTIYNPSSRDICIPVSIHFDADFHDMMDVRGIRDRLASELPTLTELLPGGRVLQFSNHGLDGLIRTTTLRFSGPSPEWDGTHLRRMLPVPSRGKAVFRTVSEFRERRPSAGRAATIPASLPGVSLRSLGKHVEKDREDSRKFRKMWPTIKGTGVPLARWADNAVEDLRVMLSRTRQGPFPYAGAPWFSTPFGRDALITGFSTLWAYPPLTRSVLSFLAAQQATKDDPFRDAEAGKILHEFRYGEAASDPTVPFGRYYGSVDATPLFVALSWAYFRRTRDREFLQSIKTPLFRAMKWIERRGVHPDSGFLVYSKDPRNGLIQKGWKDSGDSVFGHDGRIATHPIALCEVQGYLYMAYVGFAGLLSIYGDTDTARSFERKALLLRQRFNDLFWSPKIRMFSLALDGENRPCEVRTSNAGHLLMSGIALPSLARVTAEESLKEDLFSGWGIRTLGSGEVRYNPASYHNGSVWPHDNAMIMAGLSRYGLDKELAVLSGAYFDSLSMFPAERPPELYCGFPREAAGGLLSYPTSCRIQAWSVASFFLCIQSLARLDFSGEPFPGSLDAHLPSNLESLEISGIEPVSTSQGTPPTE